MDYIFFVARGDGTHFFSRRLSDHNRAVLEYQVLRRYTDANNAAESAPDPADSSTITTDR